MMNNGNPKGGYVQLPICDKSISSETAADFTLPDYQPEIKRLLRVSATVLPPSRYVGDRECEITGNIDYYVLYIGSDNAIYCAPLTGDYKISAPVEHPSGEESYIASPESLVTVVSDTVSGRVTAPRRINIKCRLRARAQVFGDSPVDAGEIGQNEDIQVLKSILRSSRVSCGMRDTVRVSDEIICDRGEGDLRVIYGEGRVLFGEVMPTSGEIFCRGDVYLKLMLCRDDGSLPYTVTRKIPISASVQVTGAESGGSATAKGTVTDMSITVEEGRIGIDLGVAVEAEVCFEEMTEHVKDVYSTERAAENVYKRVSLPTFATAFGGNFTLSDSAALDEVGIAAGAKIVDACGFAIPEEYKLEGGGCAVSGKARFSLLLEKDGEFSTAEMELPFSYRTGANGEFDRAICSAEVVSVRARADGDRVGIDAEIAISGRAYAEREKRMLSRVGFGEPLRHERGETVVCYPSKDDSLWSVAKRYGASLSRVAEANGLLTDEPDLTESLEGKNFLII